VLRQNGFSVEQLVALVRDYHDPAAMLEPDEIAIMDFARQVVRDPHRLAESDFGALRALGLSDEEILDIVLAAAARSFYSKTLDAVGTPPEPAYADLVAALSGVIAVR
jgi:alkylhydroperoxidase family enzyme